MNERPFYQKTVVKIALLVFVFQGGYFLYAFLTHGLKFAAFRFLFDLVLFFVGLTAWQFFFAQFILPVRSNKDRKKIYDRMRAGAESPALFIRGGEIIEKVGESKREEAGVIWLDTASGAVLKTLTKFTRTVGPGVVFTEKGESIAGTVDLRTQIRTAGPREGEDPFEPDAATNEELQSRRREVRALTRDGIEVVPQITVSFKIDSKPASGKEAGSRFGYNEDAVYKAISHAGINPDAASRSGRHNVVWHQLPVYVAVDLWREYLSKFTLEELFRATQESPNLKEIASKQKDNPPAEKKEPIQGRELGPRGVIFDFYQTLAEFLRNKNKKCEERLSPPLQDEEKTEESPNVLFRTHENTKKATALQAIHCMIMQRLTEPYYDVVDLYGHLTGEKKKSEEYAFLTEERGIRILDFRISNLLFDHQIEQQLLEKWTTTWLLNAKEEKKYIEGERELRKLRGKEKALLDYAKALSDELLRDIKPVDPKMLLKRLLYGTRKELIRNNRLLQKTDNEVDKLTDLIQWIDKENGHG